ncbi:MAG: hypothetical protein K8J31_20935 [Anaerolineae bacterium]|nr:hypothetical protein [Anaerolineae bacterium]
MRRLYVILTLVGLLIAVVPGRAQDDALAQEVIGRLNAWRISEGLWPLKPNDTLTALALSQAQYITSLAELPKDLHVDKQGLQPRDRALLAPFNWPHYQLPGQIAIGENAALGSVDYALNFWHNSDLHKRTVLNPAYREVGAAAVRYRGSTFFIVDFGGRPNVLPAMVDPRDGRTVYLSNESFAYARFFNSIHTATKIQMFDDSGRPLYDAPIDWAQKITVPDDAGDAVYILSTDGTHEVLSAVDLQQDAVILPESAVAAQATPLVAPTATPVPIIQPTSLPTQVAATPQPQPQNQPTAVPTATVVVVPTMVPESVVQPDLVIQYSKDTLNVMNVSGRVLDLSALSLVGTVTFPFTQWTKVTTFPLDALPTRHCLQIRSQAVSGDVVKPENCGWVRSLITVNPDRLFWAQGSFEIQRIGQTLATCEPDAGTCGVTLP